MKLERWGKYKSILNELVETENTINRRKRLFLLCIFEETLMVSTSKSRFSALDPFHASKARSFESDLLALPIISDQSTLKYGGISQCSVSVCRP